MTTGIQTLPDKLTCITRRERMIDAMTPMTSSGTETPYAFRGIIESWNSPGSTGTSALPAETGICDDVVSCAPEYLESSSRELDPVRLEKGRFYHAIKTDYHDERLENEVDDSAATGRPSDASRRVLQEPTNRTRTPPPGGEEREMDDLRPEPPAVAAANASVMSTYTCSIQWTARNICIAGLIIFVVCVFALAPYVCLFIPSCRAATQSMAAVPLKG